VYYLPVFRKFQVQILILSSFIFYAYNNPTLLLLLFLSALINSAASYLVVKVDKYQKIVAVAGVATNLSILAFFKYSPLIAVTFFKSDSSISEFLVNIPLPIGISFFTFQGISLLVDVFRGKYFKNNIEFDLIYADIISKTFSEHVRKTFLFIAFFPQLIAGPIVKAHDFIPQIGFKQFKGVDWNFVFRNLVTGYFLKAVIADNLNQFTFWIEYPYYESISSLTLLVLLFGYSMQIFSDFAGYSLIAIGLAGLFGYKLSINFNFPYISTTISEFWKRWHISLSSFLMEYLYFPLGGNRKGKIRTYFNLFITMILGGLWHGAAWSYAVWGAFHGLLLALERFLFGKKPNVTGIVKLFNILLVFSLVSIGWLLFKLPEFKDVIGFVHSVIHNIRKQDNIPFIQYVFIYSLPVIFYHIHHMCKDYVKYNDVVRKLSWILYGFMFFLILTNSGVSGSFIYFQF
jgi:alginate O-acetyltransferase complex protein AlgI